MASPRDDWTARLGCALELIGRGDREKARDVLGALWDELDGGGDPVARCAVAHHLADLQDDPHEELAWDLRALAAADELTPELLQDAGAAGTVAGLYPSLHLNLGEDHRRLGDLAAARRHLDLGREAGPALADDGYGQMIRRGLDGLAARLAADESSV